MQESNAEQRAAEILRRALELGIALEPLDGHRLRYHGPAAAINELQGVLARHKNRDPRFARGRSRGRRYAGICRS